MHTCCVRVSRIYVYIWMYVLSTWTYSTQSAAVLYTLTVGLSARAKSGVRQCTLLALAVVSQAATQFDRRFSWSGASVCELFARASREPALLASLPSGSDSSWDTSQLATSTIVWQMCDGIISSVRIVSVCVWAVCPWRWTYKPCQWWSCRRHQQNLSRPLVNANFYKRNHGDSKKESNHWVPKRFSSQVIPIREWTNWSQDVLSARANIRSTMNIQQRTYRTRLGWNWRKKHDSNSQSK